MIPPRLFTRFLAAALFLAVLLAACAPAGQIPPAPGPAASVTAPSPRTPEAGQESTPTSSGPRPTLTPTPQLHLQVEGEALRGVQVAFWHPWTGDAAERIAEITEEFNRSNIWGIQAEAVDVGGPSMLVDRVQSTLEDDTAPNLIAADAAQIQFWQAQAGTLINLSDYASDARWGLTPKEIADFPPNFWASSEVEGRRYGMPASRSAQVLFYNQSWAQELGFPSAPATLEEFQAQACAAAGANASDATRENDGTGGWIVSYDPLVMFSWMQSFGVDDLPDPETGEFRFDRESVRDTYAYLRAMFDNNCAWISRLPAPYDYFATRHALFYSGTLEEIAVQQRANQRQGAADAWTVIPYPSGGRKPVLVASDVQYAVLVNGREQQLASWLFLRWLAQPDNQARLARATGAWPASVEAMEQLADLRQDVPAWGQTLLWIPMAAPSPIHPRWRAVAGILSDASWNMFQASVTPDEIPQVLSLLDATIEDVLRKTGQ